MKSTKYFVLLAACLASFAWSKDPGRYPLRQIDRPLILPKKMWRESLVWSNLWSAEDEWWDSEDGATQGFLPTLPSVSLTDRLEWSAVPAPWLRYLLLGDNVTSGSRGAIQGLNLTLDAGISNILITDDDVSILSGLGLSFKKPMTYRLWSQGGAQLSFEGLEPFALGTDVGLGFQLTPRTHATADYILTQFFDGGYTLYHIAMAQWGVNFNSNLSLSLTGSAMYGDGESFLGSGARISFHW